MQNLPLSKLVTDNVELFGSCENVLLRGGLGLDLFAVLIVTAMEITTANIISMNKTGSSEIKLSDMGKTGWIVGPAIVGEGEINGLGSKVGVGVGVGIII